MNLARLRLLPSACRESYALLWTARRWLLRAAALPLAVLLAVNFGLAKAFGPVWMFGRATALGEGDPADGWRFLGVGLTHLVAHSLFCVAWYRALLSRGLARPELLPTPAVVHLTFQGMSLLAGLAFATVAALAIILGGFAGSDALAVALWLGGTTWLAARWQLLWPGLVDPDRFALSSAWRDLRGEMALLWPLLVLLLIPPALLAFLSDAFFRDARELFLASGRWNLGAFLDSLLTAAAVLLALAATAMPATDAYLRLSKGRPGLLPALASPAPAA